MVVCGVWVGGEGGVHSPREGSNGVQGSDLSAKKTYKKS